MAAAPSQGSAPPQFTAAASNKWLIAIAVMLATIMEVLDTTIANVALLHIRGSLSAGVDEAAWVLTSYIVANAIIIPITGWCGSYFGRKRYFLFSILLFVGSSLVAGASPNLQTLIACRVLQGIGGGAMMPLSQAILMETFPPEEQAVAMSVWGLGMMLGPVMGPLLGGWITDNYSWRWIFYVNVPVGSLAALMVATFVHDPSYIRRAIKSIDWWGLGYLSIGVACLQIMLDKGERLDWFSSHVIIGLAIFALLGTVFFIVREMTTEEPIVDLRVLHNRTFATGTLFTTIIMFAMYGTYILIPLYCQQIAGYTPLMAGMVLSIQSFATFASIVFAGRLFNRFDPRVMVAIGCLLGGYGSWAMAHFYTGIDFWNIAIPGIYRGVGSGLIFIPLSTISLGAVSKEEMGTASGLFNMVRTIGGSIGIAVLIAMLSSHAQIHQSYLSARVDTFSFGEWIRSYPSASGMFNQIDRHGQAPLLDMLYIEMQRQASVMAFLDDFRLIAYIFFFLTPLAFVMRRPASFNAPAAGH
ncbi:MAG TPA: DHA2 family efflux MFS transporter permease subunit [Candidatus Binataceae bacterium]|nr:DHA2 family efflux MFS transporter permease subunit [Candidatus Binataceae bacterium]